MFLMYRWPLVADWQTIARKRREQHVNKNLQRANQKQYDYATG
jgi:hypothetical protein